MEIDPLRRLLVYKEGESIKEDVLDKFLPKDFDKISKFYDCVGCECSSGGENEMELVPFYGKDFIVPRRFY